MPGHEWQPGSHSDLSGPASRAFACGSSPFEKERGEKEHNIRNGFILQTVEEDKAEEADRVEGGKE